MKGSLFAVSVFALRLPPLRLQVYCSHIAVSMPRDAASKLFPEAAFRTHHRTGRQHRDGTDTVIRATGDIFVPEDVAEHVEFVSGLTELWAERGQHYGWGSSYLGGRHHDGVKRKGTHVSDRIEVCDKKWHGVM